VHGEAGEEALDVSCILSGSARRFHILQAIYKETLLPESLFSLDCAGDKTEALVEIAFVPDMVRLLHKPCQHAAGLLMVEVSPFALPEDNAAVALPDGDQVDLLAAVPPTPNSISWMDAPGELAPYEDLELFAEYAGVYVLVWEETWTFTVVLHGSHLQYTSAMPHETVELFYESNDTFFCDPRIGRFVHIHP